MSATWPATGALVLDTSIPEHLTYRSVLIRLLTWSNDPLLFQQREPNSVTAPHISTSLVVTIFDTEPCHTVHRPTCTFKQCLEMHLSSFFSEVKRDCVCISLLRHQGAMMNTILLLLLLLCYCCYCYYVDKIIRPHLFEKHKMRHVVTDVP